MVAKKALRGTEDEAFGGLLGTFGGHLGSILATFWAHFGGPERTWKHIAYKRGRLCVVGAVLGRKNVEKWAFLVPQKFQNRSQNGTKKGKEKNSEKNKNNFLKIF